MINSFPFVEGMESDLIEKGRKLFSSNCTFIKVVVGMEGLPSPDRIEGC